MTGALPTDDIKGFRDLFSGRTDAYGLVHGECVRDSLEWHHWHSHLFGAGSIGVYPVVGGETRWGCTDIDTHGARGLDEADAWVHALNLQAALAALGHRSWVELTKSRGYHVWLFSTLPVPAFVMRNVLLLAHQLADVPVVEVNPKDAEGRTELGNYVNLPYAYGWAWNEPPTRIVLGVDGTPYTLSDFVLSASRLRSTPAQLDETQGLYVPPPPRASVTLRPFSGPLTAPGSFTQMAGTEGSGSITDEALRTATSKLSGKGWTIFRDGPNQGGRGFTLFRLGVECRESGLSPDETLTVLVDSDLRWGKYLAGNAGHTNGMRYITKIVEDVHG